MDDLPEPAWFAPQMITEDAYSAVQMRAERERWRGAAEDMRERAAKMAYKLVREYKGSGVIARAIRALPIVEGE
jgi:hypothetical protein